MKALTIYLQTTKAFKNPCLSAIHDTLGNIWGASPKHHISKYECVELHMKVASHFSRSVHALLRFIKNVLFVGFFSFVKFTQLLPFKMADAREDEDV